MDAMSLRGSKKSGDFFRAGGFGDFSREKSHIKNGTFVSKQKCRQ